MSVNPLPQQADYEGLRNYIRAWMARFYPGIPFEYAQIHSSKLPIPINVVEHPAIGVPFPHMAAGTSPPMPEPSSNGQVKEEGDTEDDDNSHFSPCISDILEVIEKSKRAQTTTMILSALAKAGKEWSKRTVERYLKMMIDDGTLENPKGARPPGYRFPDWSTTSDKS